MLSFRSKRRTVAPVPTRLPFGAPLAPAEPFAAIGDVHGCAAALNSMLMLLESESPEPRIILAGDLIDRGEHSADVLDLVFARRDRIVALRGNHEEMMLGFLDHPRRFGTPWLLSGGLQTLASFHIGGVSPHSSEAAMTTARDRLREGIGAEREAWLRGLPAIWTSGNVSVVHAGANPWSPITEQSQRDLCWGHRDFGHRTRSDGHWIVHGHTVVPDPSNAFGEIAIDTGAYATGVLSAAVIAPGSLRFVQVRTAATPRGPSHPDAPLARQIT